MMSLFRNLLHAYLLLLVLVLAAKDFVTAEIIGEKLIRITSPQNGSISNSIEKTSEEKSVYTRADTAVNEVEKLSANISYLIPNFDGNVPSSFVQQDATKSFFSGLKLIFPGTRWCGDGDIAKNENDLGRFNNTDACCRNHDHCPMNLVAGEEKYGLKNTGFFTRSHCSCDFAFFSCLKNAKSIIANEIGFTYFDVLSPQCFQEDYPIIGCKKRVGFLHKRCAEYEFDTNKEKIYEWFDNRKWL